jgi:hypothetical protein
MAFMRNIDPVESMKIGRRENAIEIIGVLFTIEGAKINPQNPEFIYNFLKRLERLEFPDPLYHPHNIRLLKAEMVEDHTADFMRAMSQYGAMHGKSQVLPPTPSPPIMKKEISETRLRGFAEKTVIFAGDFFLMPSIKSLEEKAPWLVKDEEQEDERIIGEQLRHRDMEKAMMKMLEDEVSSERRQQEMKHEYEKAKQEMLKRATFKINPDWASLI